MRYLLTLQYLGTRYAGWQVQANAIGVQQVVAEALSTLCRADVVVEGAGRTDAGVHAEAMRAHADLPLDIDERGLVRGVNNLLPHDIRVTAARPVPPAFHARFDAVGKRYVYRIWNDWVADVFRWPTHAIVPQPLDHEAMAAAVAAVLGTHDFRALTVADPEVSSTVRTVTEATVARRERLVEITLAADGFLRYMVRRIAGSLIEVGRGKLGTDALAASLEPRFETARWTAPAQGLTLVSVAYATELKIEN